MQVKKSVVTKSVVTKVVITGANGLNPIEVFLEDLGPRQGRVTIACLKDKWVASWGGMGCDSVAEFICSCDEYYLSGKLSSIHPSIIDESRIKEAARAEVQTMRKQRDISREDAQELLIRIDGMYTRVDMLRTESSLLVKVFGDDWHHRLPTKVNPEYEYLCRIIRTVKEALANEVVPACAG